MINLSLYRSISLWQHLIMTSRGYFKSYFVFINRACLYFVLFPTFLYRISEFDFVFLLVDHFITYLLYQWSIIFTSYIGNNKMNRQNHSLLTLSLYWKHLFRFENLVSDSVIWNSNFQISHHLIYRIGNIVLIQSSFLIQLRKKCSAVCDKVRTEKWIVTYDVLTWKRNILADRLKD